MARDHVRSPEQSLVRGRRSTVSSVPSIARQNAVEKFVFVEFREVGEHQETRAVATPATCPASTRAACAFPPWADAVATALRRSRGDATGLPAGTRLFFAAEVPWAGSVPVGAVFFVRLAARAIISNTSPV